MTFKEKLNQLYVVIDHVEKSRFNEGQKYNYVPAVEVVRAVRKALIELRLYAEINFNFDGAPYTIARAKTPGAPFSAVNVRCVVKILDLDSEETSTGSALGSGADTGDKAVYKAQTGAIKYALKNACLAPDERDPEADATVDEGAAIPEYNDYRGTEAMRGAEAMEPPTTWTPSTHYESASLPLAPPVQPGAAEVGYDSQVQTPPPAAIPFADAAASAARVADGPAAPQREPGDSDEMPSEEEMQGYRQAFAKLKTELEDAGLDSKGAPVGVKLRIFLQNITGTMNPNDITRTGWDDFFTRAANAKVKPNGLAGLVKLVNKANGIEK